MRTHAHGEDLEKQPNQNREVQASLETEAGLGRREECCRGVGGDHLSFGPACGHTRRTQRGARSSYRVFITVNEITLYDGDPSTMAQDRSRPAPPPQHDLEELEATDSGEDPAEQ